MLKDWFEAKGGVINFAEARDTFTSKVNPVSCIVMLLVAQVQPGRGHRRHLVVTADQSEDHPLEVLKVARAIAGHALGFSTRPVPPPSLRQVPFRLTMNKITMRNVGLECNGGCRCSHGRG